jgi:hypothetical protein
MDRDAKKEAYRPMSPPIMAQPLRDNGNRRERPRPSNSIERSQPWLTISTATVT